MSQTQRAKKVSRLVGIRPVRHGVTILGIMWHLNCSDIHRHYQALTMTDVPKLGVVKQILIHLSPCRDALIWRAFKAAHTRSNVFISSIDLNNIERFKFALYAQYILRNLWFVPNYQNGRTDGLRSCATFEAKKPKRRKWEKRFQLRAEFGQTMLLQELRGIFRTVLWPSLYLAGRRS